jgi:hypothetical protein
LSFTLGVFDVFGSAVPGAAYLSVLAFVLDRLGWTEPLHPLWRSTTLAAVGFAFLSYVVGVATYGLARSLSTLLTRHSPNDVAVQYFLAGNPSAAGRPFVDVNKFLLLSKIELVNREAAVEISRIRANSTMLRGLVIPTALGMVAALVDFAVADHDTGLILAALVLAGIGVLSHQRGLEMAHWAHQSTLETAYWIPEIDQLVQGSSTP